MKRILILMIIITLSTVVSARTKLTTLPDRNLVRIDLKNSTFTLVEEERTINLQRGLNKIEFAWSQTYIDMNSIQFRAIKTPGKVSVININYPPNEKALYWEVYSHKAGPGVFRISYLIHRLYKTISYEAIADKHEKLLTLKSYFTLKNMSGEKFKDAMLKLGYGKDFIKTFERGEAKKMLSVKFKNIPVVKSYHFDKNRYGSYVRMYYEITNSKKNGMAKFPLLPGKVRIFQEDNYGSEAFIGEDWGKYTPRGQTMSIYLGQAKEVKIKRYLYKNKTEKLNKKVKNYHQIIKYQIENFKKTKVPVILHEHPGGEWVVKKVVLKKETGERNKKKERVISHRKMVSLKRKDVRNLEITCKVPHTKDVKYNLYVHITLKNRW